MRLWRGDQISKLHVGDFRTEGIVTKQLRGGDPDYVSRTGLWRAAQTHVAPLFSTEREFHKTSSFLSLSVSRDVALMYASGTGKAKLEPCSDYQEDAVVFELDITVRQEAGVPGVFRLGYDCDYTLAKPNSARSESQEEAQLVSCEFCGAERKRHTMLLIDVFVFLSAHLSLQARPDAIDNAGRDKEWLVLPTDYVPRLQGFQSRVPLSRIWRAHLYRFDS